MKKISPLFLSIILIFSLAACGGGNTGNVTTEPQTTALQTTEPEEKGSESEEPEVETEAAKILVAYFSHSGNTRTVANQIHEQVGGDIFEIKTTYDYPTDHNDVLEQAQNEKNDNIRPELKDYIENMDEYETIFIGYPNWWAEMPMAVYSLLDEYDLSGKTVIPFCTHGGSGFSNTISRIKNAEPDAIVLEGLAIRDSNVNNADADITGWLNNLGMID